MNDDDYSELRNNSIIYINKWFSFENTAKEYIAEMESDRQALRSFVYENFKDVKHFDIAMVYLVNAPNCPKQFQNNHLYINKEINIGKIIFDAIVLTQNKDGVAANCISYQDKTRH